MRKKTIIKKAVKKTSKKTKVIDNPVPVPVIDPFSTTATIMPKIEEKVEVETPKVEEVKVATEEESAAKTAFRAYMDSYKIKNPVKYARKEQELLKQLKQIE